MRGQMNPRTPLALFSICAVVDFVFGLVKFHSVVGGIVAIVRGLPLTVLLFLILGHHRGRTTTTLVRPTPRDKARRRLAVYTISASHGCARASAAIPAILAAIAYMLSW